MTAFVFVFALLAVYPSEADYPQRRQLTYFAPQTNREYTIPESGGDSGFSDRQYFEDREGMLAQESYEEPYVADESIYTAVRSRPPSTFNVHFQLPSEKGNDAVSYLSKCNNTMFMKNVKDSPNFLNCFSMSEQLVCASDGLEKSYRLMLGDTLYKHCFQYMNLDSLMVAMVKQLHQEKTKVEVSCENSVPVSRCQCSHHLIELERKCSAENTLRASKLSQISTEFESCRLIREALAKANESGTRERERQTARLDSLAADVKMCRDDKDKEQLEHISTGTMLQNCTVLTQELQKSSDACATNLTIARKSLRMCNDNITDTRQKREQVYNECEATRSEIEKKLLDALPHDAENPEQVDLPLPLRKFLKVVLQRGYTQQARLFGINPELQSSSYLSKYGSKQQFTPAVPIVPPRYFLVSICGEHCAELRRKRAPSEPILSTKYSFSDPSALLNTRRYRTATGFSLEVSGTVNVWEHRFPVDSEQFHVSMFRTKRAQFFALREDGKNFEYCVCPVYEKDLLAEADEFLENMSQIDKALVSGEFGDRKPEDSRSYWQRTQPSEPKRYSRRPAASNGYNPVQGQRLRKPQQDAGNSHQQAPQFQKNRPQEGNQRPYSGQQFGGTSHNGQQYSGQQYGGSKFNPQHYTGPKLSGHQYSGHQYGGSPYGGQQHNSKQIQYNPFQVPHSRV